MGQHRFNPFARNNVVAPPTAEIKDAYGRVLAPGDEVILHGTVAPRARLLHVTPVLDPKAPPGLVQVTLRSEYGLVLKAGEPVLQMIRTQTVDEAVALGILKRTDTTTVDESAPPPSTSEQPT